MKKKINKEKSVVFSNWYDTVKLDQKGTFVNDFNKPEDYFEGTLWCIRTDEIKPFGDSYSIWYKYFVPEDTMVLEPEKVRPFEDFDEFIRTLGCAVGNVITFKKKNSDTEYCLLFNGHAITKDGDVLIYLGAKYYVLKELCDDYLFYKGGEWLPFGVKE